MFRLDEPKLQITVHFPDADDVGSVMARDVVGEMGIIPMKPFQSASVIVCELLVNSPAAAFPLWDASAVVSALVVT